MKCPHCKLINPETGLRCDCGYDFSSGTMKESYLEPQQDKFEEPGIRHWSLEPCASGIRVTIRPPTQWFEVLFLVLWMTLWVFALKGMYGRVRASADTSLGLWVCPWILGGMAALYRFMWKLIGREQVSIHNGILEHFRGLGPWGLTRHFSLEGVTRLSVHSSPRQSMGLFEFCVGAGDRLAFDYGARTISFGYGLTLAEARALLDVLQPQARLDQLRQ